MCRRRLETGVVKRCAFSLYPLFGRSAQQQVAVDKPAVRRSVADALRLTGVITFFDRRARMSLAPAGPSTSRVS
jgi:hypothetical protein